MNFSLFYVIWCIGYQHDFVSYNVLQFKPQYNLNVGIYSPEVGIFFLKATRRQPLGYIKRLMLQTMFPLPYEPQVISSMDTHTDFLKYHTTRRM